MEVEDYLAGCRSIVHNQAETARVSAKSLCDELDGLVQLRHNIGWGFHQVLVVLLGTDQKMGLCAGKMIVKHDHIVVFIEDVRFFDTGDYVTEYTAHCAPPRLLLIRTMIGGQQIARKRFLLPFMCFQLWGFVTKTIAFCLGQNTVFSSRHRGATMKIVPVRI